LGLIQRYKYNLYFKTEQEHSKMVSCFEMFSVGLKLAIGGIADIFARISGFPKHS
jgi:hypothetical protein